ncbi:uncharacterized protein MELLADRAFT_93352 [Melampsora larici-populina 98AG31]|uniref:Dynein heavy chain linker domain-containing protein n=1 Tax=Melampsora larici-populina (strain 98AG31 / pathotype 3-4-7) TaxID=747676 RepID=F4S4V8_MELLP|nr:uncharacterized protein MELLADRAFT_93352 [Melampsora larici-populina 98AG31]EGG00357.1 hypothetical protein MELLADRAFT_93352 [Melampsora larici-populina 98AG31]
MQISSTTQAVTFITFVQDLDRKVKKWEPDIEILGSGEKTLHRQRYQFPADWLYVDQIEGEWNVFNALLKRKNSAIQEQIGALQMRIVAEDKVVQSKIDALIADWEKEKPISGDLKPDIAMNAINLFETRVNRLQDEHSQPAAEEISDLKAVWTALSGIWAQLAELPLDALLTSTREMSRKMRQYQASKFVQEKIQLHQKSVALVGELKSDALRERHWKLLYKNLRLSGHYAPSQMTLGTIWDMDLKKNESLIRQVLAQATGEVALEEYKTGNEHTSALSQMKLSPYYKTFEEDALIWTDRLNRVSEMFNKWIDVQPFKSPYVLDVLQIPEVLKTLDKLLESLRKLQKALGEYLERERSSFPRCYLWETRIYWRS